MQESCIRCKPGSRNSAYNCCYTLHALAWLNNITPGIAAVGHTRTPTHNGFQHTVSAWTPDQHTFSHKQLAYDDQRPQAA
jgi:hypothetical protein